MVIIYKINIISYPDYISVSIIIQYTNHPNFNDLICAIFSQIKHTNFSLIDYIILCVPFLGLTYKKRVIVEKLSLSNSIKHTTVSWTTT